MKKVLGIGDLHFPFVCNRTLSAIYLAIKREKPDVIVQIGDLYDFYSAASFPRSHNVMTPRAEAELAREGAEAMWEKIQKIVPRAECYQLFGNHDVRPRKRVMEALPQLEWFFDLNSIFKFGGVNTIFDDRNDLEIDGVVYEHGFYSKPGMHMRENMKPTVIGHTHRGNVHFESIRAKENLWELNLGYVADPASPALSYPRKKWVKWTHGYGLIDAQGPRFCPLVF